MNIIEKPDLSDADFHNQSGVLVFPVHTSKVITAQ